MVGQYKYERLAYYPHMGPADVHLWNEFIEKYPTAFETCDYDVLVGQGVNVGDTANDIYAHDFRQLTQKRIDIVGYRPSEIWIIEVRPYAGASAMGHILGYKRLFQEKHPSETNINMAIITNAEQSDFAPLYKENGITLWTVGYCPDCPR